MKKTICITLLLISIASGVFFASSQKNPAESCAAAVDKNFTLLSNAYSVETLLNSSPYAYIDNDFYRNIVSLGFDAVQVLQEKNADGEFSDLNSYIAAIAIQEITGCNLYSITGIDFETADEFYSLWDKTIADMPENLTILLGDHSMDVREKITALKKYGIFGEAAAYAVSESSTETMPFLGESDADTFTESEKLLIKGMIHSSTNELCKAADYLAQYQK